MITTFEDLPSIRKQHSDEKVVYATGVFDLCHEGHIALLRLTKSLGDIAVIGIVPDTRVKSTKGSLRPVQPEATRLAVVSELKPVDYAFITPAKPCPYEYTGHQIVDQLRPNVLVTSYDIWRQSEEWLGEMGTELVVVPRLDHDVSTTTLINDYVARLSEANSIRQATN